MFCDIQNDLHCILTNEFACVYKFIIWYKRLVYYIPETISCVPPRWKCRHPSAPPQKKKKMKTPEPPPLMLYPIKGKGDFGAFRRDGYLFLELCI